MYLETEDCRVVCIQPQPFSLCCTMLAGVRLKTNDAGCHSLLHSFVQTVPQASTPSPPPPLLLSHCGISACFVMSPAAINKANPRPIQTSLAGSGQLVTNLFGTGLKHLLRSVFCLRGLVVRLGRPLNMSSQTEAQSECPSGGRVPKTLSLHYFLLYSHLMSAQRTGNKVTFFSKL